LIEARFADRLRKRKERAEARSEAARQRAVADAALRDRLIAATYGGYTAGPALDDVAPIRAAMELVPLDRVLQAIRYKTDRKCDPKNTPATSWREPRLLKAIAEHYCRFVLVPSMVDNWKAAGTTPGKPVERAEAPPAVLVPPRARKRIHSAATTACCRFW
jgi:hypothetical protein